MKRYTLIASTISLFLGTQIVSMDRTPSTRRIDEFTNFLTYKFNNPSVIETLLADQLNDNTTVMLPLVRWDLLIEYKLEIIDRLTKHQIDRPTGKSIFIAMLAKTIKQAIIVNNHRLNEAMIQSIYQTYLENILRTASTIFDR